MHKHCVNTKWSKFTTTSNYLNVFRRTYTQSWSSQSFQNTKTIEETRLRFLIHVSLLLLVLLLPQRVHIYIINYYYTNYLNKSYTRFADKQSIVVCIRVLGGIAIFLEWSNHLYCAHLLFDRTKSKLKWYTEKICVGTYILCAAAEQNNL